VGGTQIEPLDSDQFRFSTSVETVRRDRWHQGRREVAGPAREASSVVLSSRLSGAITGSLGVEASLPFAWLDASDAIADESRTGAGDLLTRLHWRRTASGWSYGLSAGAYWPVGNLGSEELPATATFSSGTVDPSVGGFVSLPRVGGWGCQVSWDARLVASERDAGSRLGSSFAVSLGWDRSLTRRLAGQVVLTYFGRASDEGNPMEDTGGDWLYFHPFMSANVFVRPSYALQVTAGGRIPVVQNVRGTQLVESPSLSLGIAQTFRL
jgi:hypothetical protein